MRLQKDRQPEDCRKSAQTISFKGGVIHLSHSIDYNSEVWQMLALQFPISPLFIMICTDTGAL